MAKEYEMTSALGMVFCLIVGAIAVACNSVSLLALSCYFLTCSIIYGTIAWRLYKREKR